MAIPDQERQRIAAAALSLPDVTAQRMFGADTYLVQGKMFAFLTDDRLVVKLTPDHGAELLRRGVATRFTHLGNRFGDWIAVLTDAPEDIGRATDLLNSAYENVRRLPARSRSRRKATIVSARQPKQEKRYRS